MAITSHARGRLVTLAGVMILSFDTLLVRLIDASAWTLIFWRGVLPAVTLFIIQWVADKHVLKQHLLKPTRLTLLTSSLFCASTICFVFSLAHTEVASTLVITNTAPLITAILGYVFLKEVLDRATVIAIVVAVGGIWLVFGYQPSAAALEGDSLALVSAISMSVYLIALRKTRGAFGSVYLILSGALVAVVALVCGAEPFSLHGTQWVEMGLLGALVLPWSFWLIAKGPRDLPAAEASLILLLEILFGPLLVWWIIGEAPSANVLAGAAVIMASLGGLSIWQWRKSS